ncbi:MAG TPA: phosphoribosylglycinamide formyltransferase [Thermoplasmata archaeon]|nr:phosphoribosylglycinamide formyltransferase [Thermoplasmata archaeon]
MTRVLPLGVLISGEGTTLDALAETIAGGHLPARICVVIADRPHAPGVERARRRGLPTAVIPFRGTSEEEWSRRVDRSLRDTGVELVVLAGFLAVLPGRLLARWPGRVINVHPSLLPEFGGRGMFGMHVHEAVLAAGVAETGATVHLVTDDLDGGPKLLQERVPVAPNDTAESLRERVRPVERRLLFDAIRHFADGDWSLPFTPPEERSPPREPRGARGS